MEIDDIVLTIEAYVRHYADTKDFVTNYKKYP